jgi:hypothetical protein
LERQRIKKICWYPNKLRKSAGIPTERKRQSKSAGFMGGIHHMEIPDDGTERHHMENPDDCTERLTY